jgi:hypothetical protein
VFLLAALGLTPPAVVLGPRAIARQVPVPVPVPVPDAASAELHAGGPVDRAR